MSVRWGLGITCLLLLATSIGCGDASVAHYAPSTTSRDESTAPQADAAADSVATNSASVNEPAVDDPAADDVAVGAETAGEATVAEAAPTQSTSVADSGSGAASVELAAAEATPAAADTPATPPVRPPVRTRDGLLDITFDHLKFDIEKDEKFDPTMITPQLKKLDNDRVRLRGYILPSFQQSGITQFILVRDNMECCFGPGAALYDCVVVEMASGKSTDFTTYPVAVAGRFTLQNYEDADGVVRAVFHITADTVK